MNGTTATGRVSWFNVEKQFGFVKLDDRLGDAPANYRLVRMGLMSRRASGWRFSDAANEAAHQSIAVFNLGLAAWATGAYVGNGSKADIASQRCTGSLGRCRFLKSSMPGCKPPSSMPGSSSKLIGIRKSVPAFGKS